METNIYLVRHAHSNYTPEELRRPLSAEGFQSAYHVGEVLVNEHIDVFVSSPYQRAIQTVAPAADKLEKEIIIDGRFKERKLAEKPVDDFLESVSRLWENPSFSYQGGESNKVAQKRGVSAIYELLEKFAGNNVAVGTHGNLMVLIMNHFHDCYDFDFWNQLSMPDIYQLTFINNKLIAVNRVYGETIMK